MDRKQSYPQVMRGYSNEPWPHRVGVNDTSRKLQGGSIPEASGGSLPVSASGSGTAWATAPFLQAVQEASCAPGGWLGGVSVLW